MRSQRGGVQQDVVRAFASAAASVGAHLNIVLSCLLGALLLSLASWALLLGNVAAERAQGSHDAARQAQAMARAYAEQVGRAISAHDLLLRQVRYGWEASQHTLRLDTASAADMYRGAPFANLAILGRDGAALTAMRARGMPADASQAAYFRVHAAQAGDPLVISALTDGAGRVDMLQLSRALHGADGRFDGVVLIQVDSAKLGLNFFQHRFPAHGLLGLMRGDGRLLLAATAEPAQPVQAQAPPIAGAAGTRLVDASRFADRRARYLGWQRADALPLVAFVGLDQAGALAPFDAARATAVRHAGVASAAIFAAALLIMGLLLRLTWRKREAQLTDETYRMATEGSSDGFFILAILLNGAGAVDDFEVVDCNGHGAALCHQRREDLIGRRFSALYRDETFARVMDVLGQAVETGAFDGELEFQPHSSYGARWMRLKAVRSDGKLAITLRDISESKAHVAALEHRGNHDALTGLPNRHWLQWYLPQAIERARSLRQSLALLFIDLDGFKSANDSMGHAAGDELLRHAAHRLKEAVRPHDNVVRIGGDEFVVILENNLRAEDSAIVAKRVLFAFKPKFKLIGGTAVLGTSIGISSFPRDGDDAAALLQNADVAMYSVKTSGKGSYRFFDPDFYEALRMELEFEKELRRAIETDEFVIHYQPRMDLISNRTTSMEALVRWVHPVRGLLEPKDFIPLAEKSGMIVRLGELVLVKVCEQLAQWVVN
ncbi:MAG: diguanylate cyclase, partial [Pseudomonadota bacterium]|nr:diguanylate cyclase [Pseudomonadota bacterium]